MPHPLNRAARRQASSRQAGSDPQTLKLAAARAFEAGDLPASEALCADILKNLPKDGDTLHLLGAVRLRQERAQEAVQLLEAALRQNAHRITCTRNLADAYGRAGQLPQAVATAEQLLHLQDSPANRRMLGNFLLRSRRAAEAMPHLAAAYAAQPSLDLASDYAVALIGAGRGEEAQKLLQAALAQAPGHVGLATNLAEYHRTRGEFAKAEDILACACQAAPQTLALWTARAGLAESCGDLRGSLRILEAASRHLPENATLAHLRAQLLMRLEEPETALPLHRQAVGQEPLNIGWWNAYATTLAALRQVPDDASFRTDLITLFSLPTVNHAPALRMALALLRRHPGFQRLHGSVTDRLAFARHMEQPECIAFLSDPLLIQVLQSIFVPDWPLEQVLTQLRRALLDCAAVAGFAELALPFPEDLLQALAHQCFLNEYVFGTTPEEDAQVAVLATAISHRKGAFDQRLVALYGCYAPLWRLPQAQALLRQGRNAETGSGFAFLLQRQIAEPLRERQLAASIPQLTPVATGVSSTVQAMYEENPYPRWDTFTDHKAHRFADYWRSHCPWLDRASIAETDNPRILIAGCGTGKHAFHTASLFRNADVLAVDLSRASLAFARRKQLELNIPGVRLMQGDILGLKELPDRFDQIESAGVLHHMADPVAGWRVLTKLLKPGGFMKIALYSALARRHVVAGRAMVAAEGYTSNPASIRRWRQAVMQQPEAVSDAPSPRQLAVFTDFFSLSMCRDLVFHVQEHRFTLPQIQGILEDLRLEFLGFEFPPQHPALRQYKERFSDDPHGLSLSNWAVFETEFPDTFRAMYQFCVRKAPSV